MQNHAKDFTLIWENKAYFLENKIEESPDSEKEDWIEFVNKEFKRFKNHEKIYQEEIAEGISGFFTKAEYYILIEGIEIGRKMETKDMINR